jgi:hypothetical protein
LGGEGGLGDGILRISEVFEVFMALENFGNTDLSNPMAVNSYLESFPDL